MYWRLHTAVFQDRIDEAVAFLKTLDNDVQVVSGYQHGDNVLQILNTPALAITTIQDAQKLGKAGYVPWLYYHQSAYDVSNWMFNLHENVPVLNRQGIFLPCGALPHIKSSLLTTLANNGKIFIRPNSGNKLFTGFSVNIDNWDYEIKHVMDKTGPSTLVLLAPHIDLQPVEWRFWIVDSEVVAHSPYSWEQDNIPLTPVDWETFDIAYQVARDDWQVDASYVVDIVVDTNNNYYVNEINATSTSGVYNVDFSLLFPALREAAINEYNDRFDF